MKTTNSEGCINNEQQNSLPHILPFSINTTVSRLLGAAFKLSKTHSPNLCIPFFFFLPPLISYPLSLQVVILCAFQNKPLACHPHFYH